MKMLCDRKRQLATVMMFCVMSAFLCVGCPHHEIVREEQQAADVFLTDDSAQDKKPEFISDLIDSRPLEFNGNIYEVNLSAAVIGLDVPGVPPEEAELMNTLRPSYADAIAAAKKRGLTLLPSVNMINGKAKQFDDGLYAAMDLAYYRGVDRTVPGFPDLMRRFYEATKTNPNAAAFFSAGLSISGIEVDPVDAQARKTFLEMFNVSPVSKPIGFYTWNKDLETLWRFFSYFQQRIEDRAVADAVAAALVKDEALRKDYDKLLAFYSGLTNPFIDLSCMDLIEGGKVSGKSLDDIAAAKGLPKRPIGPGVCVLPYSGSTETVLFEKLFPLGLPENVNLMKELITRIRSGKVDLAPGEKSGWYSHQVYALETLLLPEKGPEARKLCMSAKYKERTLEAFKAILTKTRETHARQGSSAFGCATAAVPPATPVAPRLRLEPAPSFCLRTARSYAFVEKLVTSSLGKDALHSLHRIKQDGQSAMPLDEELRNMKNLFYGFYLVCCEDIGLKPELADGEVENADDAKKAAGEWLATFATDPDLEYDTRVSVPIFTDLNHGTMTLWATLGVRLANLKATYVKPPSIRLKDAGGDWTLLHAFQMGESQYVIPVDEFSEITLPRLGVLTREELRAVCDEEKTKDKIIAALQKK